MVDSDDFADVIALTNGARFVRGDLHIHSYGGSHDVTDITATPTNIVQTAIAHGLSVIAIADHNAINNVAPAITAAALDNLLVVPAVELSTMQGHLLCYLPSLQSLSAFYSQLTVRDLGLPTSRVDNPMVDCLTKMHVLGGFGVLAHVDGPKGLEVEVPGAPPYKADIINHPALLGIELKNAGSSISYSVNDPDNVRKGLGKTRSELHDGTLPTLARVLNSDSHTLQALGRNAAGDNKVTRYKMQSLTFESLRHAMTEGDSRVRLEDELPKSVPTVTGIRFKGGFLKDQAIHFSSNLTCIIGGRGTGKSTMFEGVRAFSKTPSGASVVNSDVWPERIDIQFVDGAGAAHRLCWSKGDDCGTNINDPFDGPDTIPVECYGQGETQKISEQAQADPGALLRYLDRFTNVLSETVEEERIRAEIAELEIAIDEARGKVALIPQYERELSITKQQIKKFTDGNAKGLIETYQQIESERQSRRSVMEHARAIAKNLNYEAVKTSLGLLKAAADESKLVLGKDEFAAIKTKADDFESNLSVSEGDLKAGSQALSQVVTTKVEEWSKKETTLLATVDSQKSALEAQGITVNTTYIAQLTRDEATHQTSVTNLKTWEPRLSEKIKERDEVAVKRWSARAATYQKRRAFAASATVKLRSALSDLNVSLKFEENAHSPQARDLLIEIMGWRTNQVPRASVIERHLTVPKLLAAIRAKDPLAIASLVSDEGASYFNTQEANTLIERFSEPKTLARLETMQVFDRPYLTVTREVTDGSGQKHYRTREFAQLSLGQQQSVLLALMLSSENPNPLLIDQPEDNLDGQFIYSQLVPVIRLAKERRQIIIVTHNPNIAVLGDAEQIVVLGANSEQAVITSRGSIDHEQTRDITCSILEGAKAAFTRRGKIYGI
ncbi:AAA family ATPase [Altererythrobacter sp. H2]|uniref:TrlF family AAA-like ATPase n=1 Tax=Altererythrobacter sp. H2 TaxID=3108391 RepID=UPI002B4C1E7D|nr:AAA family ATPase [Altererythrobacter sp. H2]WRK95799.1 AAA family ATPase [Altererythrobacter sp. H2]